MPLPPVMIYGDDVTHVVTEEGIANLLLCRDPPSASRRSAAWPATPRSASRDKRMVENLRDRGVIHRPEDLRIDRRRASVDRAQPPVLSRTSW